jgi:Tol biopolymer transport system component
MVFSVGSMRHPPALYAVALHGSGTPELILPPGGIERAEDWSPDGRFLLYFGARTESGSGLWVLNPDGEPKPRKLLSVGRRPN